MNNQDEKLENFIKKIYDIQHSSKKQILTNQELRSIALDTGMTTEDWNYLQRELHNHIDRGKGFLKFNNY